MKKLYAVVLIVIVLASSVTTVYAGKKPPKKSTGAAVTTTLPPESWFGTFGVADLPKNGVIYAAAMNYPYQKVGFYTISGNSFVGASASMTQISGTCFTGLSPNDTAFPLSAVLVVDGSLTVPLFNTTQPFANFSAVMYGTTFQIVITTAAPLGCNVILESKQ